MPNRDKVKSSVLNPPAYPYEDSPAPGILREVGPGGFWLRMPLPFALEHINLWLLADNDGWTIVDCGFGTDETRDLWHAISSKQLHGKRVTRIVVTHFHPDHFGLAGWLAAHWQAPVLMSEPEYIAAQAWHASREPFTREAHFAMFEQHGLGAAGDGDPRSRDNLFRRGVPDIPEQITPLHD